MTAGDTPTSPLGASNLGPSAPGRPSPLLFPNSTTGYAYYIQLTDSATRPRLMSEILLYNVCAVYR